MVREVFFFKKYAKNEAGRLISDPFLFFKKALYEIKASGLKLGFNIFRWPSTYHTTKANCMTL